METHKYNFIIFGSDWDLYTISYSDISRVDYAHYFAGIRSIIPFLGAKLYSAFIRLPFFRRCKFPFPIWKSVSFGDFFVKEKPLCFIFFRNWCYLNRTHFFTYITSRYPDAKKVFFLQDLVTMEEKSIFQEFDLIISFDHEDCRRYNLLYHPLVFSTISLNNNNPVELSDVFFLGKAKNRLEVIYEVYNLLRTFNLKCVFLLVDVPKEKRKYEDGIRYVDGLSYSENLYYISNTRCVLEVMQKNGHGYTQRANEIIAYQKKLLTNNPEIVESPFYDERFICYFDEPQKIRTSFLERISSNEQVKYNYKNQSPIDLLNFIETNL